jgi:putative ATP-dependent endonuclease of OLD family
MRACRVNISHFRGIKTATVLLPKHAVLIGDNNTGKTTILEALDLALGPDRLNRFSPIDEHDFYHGEYLAKSPADEPAGEGHAEDGEGGAPELEEQGAPGDAENPDAEEDDAPRIEIEVAIADLSEDQKARFGDYVEFWDSVADQFYAEPNPEGVDPGHITEALRVTFHGWYDVT